MLSTHDMKRFRRWHSAPIGLNAVVKRTVAICTVLGQLACAPRASWEIPASDAWVQPPLGISGGGSAAQLNRQREATSESSTDAEPSPNRDTPQPDVAPDGVAERLRAGSVVITEIMNDPAATPDLLGEWVELYNPTSSVHDLAGCWLHDADRDAHRIRASLTLRPGQYIVLARSADALGTHQQVDYVYDGFRLANTTDEVMLLCGNLLVDEVRYDRSAGYPAAEGTSLSLDPDHTNAHDNDRAEHWCLGAAPRISSEPTSIADGGTPGRANRACAP